jgi:hypothetical protein
MSAATYFGHGGLRSLSALSSASGKIDAETTELINTNEIAKRDKKKAKKTKKGNAAAGDPMEEVVAEGTHRAVKQTTPTKSTKRAKQISLATHSEATALEEMTQLNIEIKGASGVFSNCMRWVEKSSVYICICIFILVICYIIYTYTYV